MSSHEDLPDESSGAASEAESLHLTDKDLFETLKSRPVIIAAIVAGAATAAVIGAKIAYDRRKSAKGYHRAVRQLEDAKDALIAATSEVPERSRAVVRRVMHR